MRFILVVSLLWLAMSSATAQSTDVVQRLTFVLKGTTQTSSGVKAVRVGNKDILAALNASGAFNFGPNATLLILLSDEQPPALMVQEGEMGQATNTDVSEYFGVTEIGDEVRSAGNKTVRQTWRFAFDNGNPDADTGFQLWGATTIHRGPIHTPGIGTVAGPQHVESSVRGVGRLNGAVTVFSGTVSGGNSSLISD